MNKRELLSMSAAAAFTALPQLGFATAGSPVRLVDVDVRRVKGARNMAWQYCVGSDFPGSLQKPEALAQLALCKRELGFKYVRFHDIFHDVLGTYKEVDGAPVYDFTGIGRLYDGILAAGMKPFVEVGFMPEALASGTDTIFYWRGHTNLPKDYDRWAELITKFAQFLIGKYGPAEVRTWPFEIWNEPNLDGFFRGTQADYFRIYDTTVRALKAVDARLKVGGPGTAGAAWVPDMIAHTNANHVPLDFVSTHTYGVEWGYLDENGQGDNRLTMSYDSVVNDMRRVRAQVEGTNRSGLPIHFTEWSTSYSPRDPIHDAYLSASFILDKIKRAEGLVQSLSYWTFSDLFEEAGPPPSSFHGGFGLLNRESIRKPSYFAYKYLNGLGGQELAQNDSRAWVTKSGQNISALIWDFTLPDQTQSNRPYYRQIHPAADTTPAHLSLQGLTQGRYRLTLNRVGYRANDAYTRYMDWGRPDNLTEAQISELHGLTADRPETTEIVVVGRDGKANITVALRVCDAVLVKLQKI